MLRLSVCIDLVLAGLSIEECLHTVADAEIDAYEFWDYTSRDWRRLNELRCTLGLHTAAFMMEPRGILVQGAAPGVLLEGLEKSIKVAQLLGCRNLITLAGRTCDIDRRAGRENLVKGLKLMAPMVEDKGITLLLEPLNTVIDHPGYFLSSSKEAVEIVQEVDSPNVRILFDIYHQQVTEGNLITNIQANLDWIGHFHVADVPGRHEPGTGEINYDNIFRWMKDVGYDDFVGLEYKPLKNPLDTLRSIKAMVDRVDLIT